MFSRVLLFIVLLSITGGKVGKGANNSSLGLVFVGVGAVV